MNWFDTTIFSTILKLHKQLEKEKQTFLNNTQKLEFSSGKC